jgi:AbiV family abortive infection protein
LKAFYEELAKASYKNSLDLMSDSEALRKRKRYPTALALAVLAGEEFAKAYLCKCYSCGKISKRRVDKAFKEHDPKLMELTRILTSAYLFTRFYVPAIEHDSKTTDHVAHLFPYVKIDPSAAMEPVHGLMHGLQNKIPALDVGKKRSTILEPTKLIDEGQVEQLLPTLGTFIYGFDIILNSSDETFGRIYNMMNNFFNMFTQLLTELAENGNEH